MLGLVAAALAIDFRGRLMVAGAVALALVCLHDAVWPKRWLLASCWLHLGKQSYSVFLITFVVCLLANVVVTHLWPGQLVANSLGLGAAFALSLLAGCALYHAVKSPSALWRVLRLPSLLRC